MEEKNIKKKAIIIGSIIVVIVLSIIVVGVCMNKRENKYDYIQQN